MAARRPDRLPLSGLRAFDAAARLGSFTHAGREVFLTHGAISRHVRNLEAFLGYPLFERTGRGVVLTRSGERFHAEVRAALAHLHAGVAMDEDSGIAARP